MSEVIFRKVIKEDLDEVFKILNQLKELNIKSIDKESIEVFVRDKITLDNFNTLLDSRALLYLFSLYDKTFFENDTGTASSF